MVDSIATAAPREPRPAPAIDGAKTPRGGADRRVARRPARVAERHREVVRDLESRLVAYARQAKMSEWLESRVGFLGALGVTAFGPDYDIEGGVPHEKP